MKSGLELEKTSKLSNNILKKKRKKKDINNLNFGRIGKEIRKKGTKSIKFSRKKKGRFYRCLVSSFLTFEDG